jgi:hypothetical protein
LVVVSAVICARSPRSRSVVFGSGVIHASMFDGVA